VDQDDNVLDILVQSRRNKKAAKKFFRKLLEQKTVGGAFPILAQISLGSAGRFAPFDHLIAVTVKASDRNK
jgi:DDE domain